MPERQQVVWWMAGDPLWNSRHSEKQSSLLHSLLVMDVIDIVVPLVGDVIPVWIKYFKYWRCYAHDQLVDNKHRMRQVSQCTLVDNCCWLRD